LKKVAVAAESSEANGGNLKPVEVPGIRKGICDR
jgi:hypothetical protein